MSEFRVGLMPEDERALKKYLYDMLLESAEDVKRDLSLDRDLIDKKTCCEWLGISPAKLDELFARGAPISVLGERTFFISKTKMRAWILANGEH
jgi:hypothetical protein